MCYLWYYLTSLAVLLFIVFLNSLIHQIFTFYISNGAYHCSFLSVNLFSFIFHFFFFSSSAMSKSFIMEMGDLDSENRKVLSGPPSTLQLSFQFVRELFTVYIICIVEK